MLIDVRRRQTLRGSRVLLIRQGSPTSVRPTLCTATLTQLTVARRAWTLLPMPLQDIRYTMCDATPEICSLDDLRRYVRHTLCERENLLLDQFPMSEMKLSRGGQACGLQFCVHGPRSVKLQAIWAADHNLVYFYDASGERFLKVQLPRRIPQAA